MNIPPKSVSIVKIFTNSNQSNDSNSLLNFIINIFPFEINAKGTILL